jgi:hypothetical protein
MLLLGFEIILVFGTGAAIYELINYFKINNKNINYNQLPPPYSIDEPPPYNNS